MEEARDIVQDAFVNLMKRGEDGIENEKAYLVRTVINLSINRKKRQQKMLASYPGEWLPEPVATEKADRDVVQKDILSYSLMVLLEKLNPRQRAVFILKEAFDYDHDEIAGVLNITAENSRKILSRAKSLLQMTTPVEERVPTDYLNQYVEVNQKGDLEKLEKMLNHDILVVSDGGGKAVAFRNPILGREHVLALLLGIQRKYYADARIERGLVNHQPALFYYDADKLVTCQIFDFRDGHLAHVYFMRNPDKLKSLKNLHATVTN